MKKSIFIFSLASLMLCAYQSRVTPIQLEKRDTIMQAEIKGEVIQPGVYEISKNETIKDLIEQAQGISEKADLSSLSLMQNVLANDVIVIPQKTEQEKISLNSAPLEQLTCLSGIGEAKALLIIEYREKQPFLKIEDLMNVKGIGKKIFEKNKDILAL